MDDFKNYREEKYKIEIIKEFEDPDECGRAENYMIRDHMLLKDGLCLNRACCCGGEKVFSTVGTHHSEETRKKIGLAQQGRHHSEEVKQKISRARKGQSLSEETRKKQSEALKGRQAWNKGRSPSEETRKKQSEALKGRQATNQIKISIEGMVFDSCKEASKYHNVSNPTISYWLKTKKHNAFYVEK